MNAQYRTLLQIALSIVMIAILTSTAIGQIGRPDKENGDQERSPVLNAVVIRDHSHPVWKALQAQYAKLAEALKKKDINALFALYTPDFRAVTPTGEVWSRERSLAYQRNGLAQVKETTHISNTIVRLILHGENAATASVLQQWYRTQMMVGKLCRVETHAVQDEEWTKTPDGWKRGNIQEVQNGAAFVDGKRVDTNKPYDPEAPAYDPDDPHPRQPVADMLFVAITEKGIERGLEQYRLLYNSDQYYVSEATLNALGYRLLAAKKIVEAIEVFRLNVQAYPQSANVYDSLGEAYLASGDKKRALANYEKSLKLNPRNDNAAAQVQRIRGN